MKQVIGLSISLIANLTAWNISNDWRIPALAIVCGIGAIIYCDD